MILTGVGLNAAAQLLLKVATRPLAHFSDFSADTLGSSILILAKSLPFWTGMVCYAASLCVWLAALSKAPVSTAYPMLSLGYVVVAAVSVMWLGESLSAGQGVRHRVDLRRRGSGFEEFCMKPFLPFTRPSIDADSIAAVGEVLRSGQLASGPKVQAFEGALAAYLGGKRQVRVMTSATAGLEMALEVAGIGPGDEVIVPAMSFAASANVVARLRAKPVFVDIDLYTRNINRGSGARRHHAENARHHAGAFRRAAGGHGRCSMASPPSMACGWSRMPRMPSVRATGTSPSAASAIWWCSAFIRTRT